jgi:enoyl-CoA hydratase/carnithine racemase
MMGSDPDVRHLARGGKRDHLRPAYDIGSVPADGIHNCFQELLGVKRAAYALLTGQAITAEQALEWGMVNEVVPRDELIARAYAIADHIMTQPRTVRRLTTQKPHSQHCRLRPRGPREQLRRGKRATRMRYPVAIV